MVNSNPLLTNYDNGEQDGSYDSSESDEQEEQVVVLIENPIIILDPVIIGNESANLLNKSESALDNISLLLKDENQTEAINDVELLLNRLQTIAAQTKITTSSSLSSTIIDEDNEDEDEDETQEDSSFGIF